MGLSTEEISTRFNDSFTMVHTFYSQLINDGESFEHFIPIYLYIQKLRQAGEAHFFRLGISKQDLIFSRSAEMDLRKDQPFIKIKVLHDSYEITLQEGKKMIKQYLIKDLDDTRLSDSLKAFKEITVD